MTLHSRQYMINEKIITRVLLFLIVADFVMSIIGNSGIYTRKYDHEYFSEIYSGSQYVLGPASTRSIGDDGLYPFAGYYYITGGDPSQVNFENPTLGKYLIGFSAYVLGNENLIYVFYAVVVLFTILLLARRVFKSTMVALVTVLLLEVSPFFKLQFIPTSPEQLSIALLDLPLLVFFCAGIYFFLEAFKKPKLYWVSSLFLACTFVTKFFPALVLLIPVLGAYLFYKKQPMKVWFFSLVTIPFVYMLSYAAYFYYHPSFIEFLRYQKWIIDWRLGNPFVVGNIFRTIFTGRYQNWWDGGTVVDTEWTFYFAFVVIAGMCGGIVAFLKKEKELSLLAAISFVYVLYLALNTVGVARYILLVYPFFTILAVRFGIQIFAIIQKWLLSISRR